MSFLKKLFGIGDKPGTPSFRLKQSMSVHGQPIKYVTEHIDGNENIVGRGGAVSVIDGNLVIDTSGERLFACDAKTVDVSWLMSGNGAVIPFVCGKLVLDTASAASYPVLVLVVSIFILEIMVVAFAFL